METNDFIKYFLDLMSQNNAIEIKETGHVNNLQNSSSTISAQSKVSSANFFFLQRKITHKN